MYYLKRKLFTSLMFILAFFILIGCNEEETISNDLKIIEIAVDESTIASSYAINTFDITSLELILTKSDGEIERVNVNSNMLNRNDYGKLKTVGTHDITIMYQNLETTITLSFEENPLEHQLLNIYQSGIKEGTIDGSYEDWLASVKGEQGVSVIDARINEQGELILTFFDDTEVNVGLVSGNDGQEGVDGINGIDGEDGINGVDGKSVEFQLLDGYLQWRYKDNTLWYDLLSLDLLNGKSAYDLYLLNYPNYDGSETAWLNDLVNGNLADIETYDITMNYNNSDSNVIFQQNNLTKLVKPTPPVKEGYVFAGWYYNDLPWLFSVYPVTESITLDAKWTPIITGYDKQTGYVSLGDTYTLPTSIQAYDYFGEPIIVEVEWSTPKYYGHSAGTDKVFGHVVNSEYSIEVTLHTYDVGDDNNVVTGYVTGQQDDENPVVILSNQSVAYYTYPDDTGYYEFLHVANGDYTVRVELNGYLMEDPVLVSFTDSTNEQVISTQSIKANMSPHIKHVDFELISFNPGHFSYQWRYGGSYFGFEQSTTVLVLPTITFYDDVLTGNDTSAGLKLKNAYNVYLDDSNIQWNSEYASRLLEIFNKIPTAHHELKDSKWILTEDHIDNDIIFQNNDSYTTVTISIDAFKNATPKLAEIDAVKGVFYSDRLYHAVIRYVTDEGTNTALVDTIFQERFGVSIIIPSYVDLTVDNEIDEHFEMFKPEELLSILKMFEELPEGMHKVDGLNYLVRRVDGLVNPHHPLAPAIAWTSHGYIEFMGNAFTTTSENYLHRLIVHEKSHFLWDYLFDQTIKDMWIELGGWYETSETASGWATTKTTEFVSAYAHLKNPNEDMAETISYYLLNPEGLKSRSMDKYNFIKDYIMHGTTYMTQIREDLTFEVYNLFPDYDYPGKIKRVSIDVLGDPTEDKTLTVEIELNDDEGLFDGASQGIMRIYSDLGTYIDLYVHPINDNGSILRGQATISKYAKSGFWYTDQIIITDTVGNQRFEGVSHYGWKMYVDNPLEDTTAPTYVNDTLAVTIEDTVLDGQTVYDIKVTFQAIDDNLEENNGAYVSIDPESNTLYRYESYGTCNVDTGLCTVEFTFTDYYPNGKYYINYISIRDKAGNITNINFPTQTTDEQPVVFNVETKNEDLVPPNLDINNIDITATPTNPDAPDGETLVTITYFAKDNASGLGTVAYKLKDPQGSIFHEYHYHENVYTLFFEGDPTVWKLYTINVLLPRGSAPGIWGLQEIYMKDKAGNFIVYNFEEIIRFDIIDEANTETQ